MWCIGMEALADGEGELNSEWGTAIQWFHVPWTAIAAVQASAAGHECSVGGGWSQMGRDQLRDQQVTDGRCRVKRDHDGAAALVLRLPQRAASDHGVVPTHQSHQAVARLSALPRTGLIASTNRFSSM
jgi:hypothetical protein